LEQCNVPYLVRCFSVCLSPGFWIQQHCCLCRCHINAGIF
jgi:hypothetical protein